MTIEVKLSTMFKDIAFGVRLFMGKERPLRCPTTVALAFILPVAFILAAVYYIVLNNVADKVLSVSLLIVLLLVLPVWSARWALSTDFIPLNLGYSARGFISGKSSSSMAGMRMVWISIVGRQGSPIGVPVPAAFMDRYAVDQPVFVMIHPHDPNAIHVIFPGIPSSVSHAMKDCQDASRRAEIWEFVEAHQAR
jgi:hypothetical protein